MIVLFSEVYESKHVINFTHNLEKKTHLSIDKSVSLGLIINEIVSNINEHAYQEEEIGTIEIGLVEKGKLLCLMIDDQGKGIKPNTEKEKSMGLKIISLLCAKLGASAEMKNLEKGVRVSITFKNGI
jgi:two-component sensor histidine kinase